MSQIGPNNPFAGVTLGSAQFWAILNECAEWAYRLKTMEIGPGMTGSEVGPFGVTLAASPPPLESASELGWYRVKNVTNDWLECAPVGNAEAWTATLSTETDAADLVKVNKPWWLRVSTWNGQTWPLRTGTLATYTNVGADTTGQTRTVELSTDDTTTETQVVTPAYRHERVVDGTRYAGSLILAANKRLPGAVDGGSLPINWTDVTPRQWAKQSASEH